MIQQQQWNKRPDLFIINSSPEVKGLVVYSSAYNGQLCLRVYTEVQFSISVNQKKDIDFEQMADFIVKTKFHFLEMIRFY